MAIALWWMLVVDLEGRRLAEGCAVELRTGILVVIKAAIRYIFGERHSRPIFCCYMSLRSYKQDVFLTVELGFTAEKQNSL